MMQFRIVLVEFLNMLLIVNVLSENKNIDHSKSVEEKAIVEFLKTFPVGPKSLINGVITQTDLKLFANGKKSEDVHLTIEELIKKYGYVVEKYEVPTEDGYILTLFRIPSARPGRPIFLMHGLFCSADDWVTAGVESGIPYLLAAEGFDVWLGNARGSKHSRRHLHLSPDSVSFWDFSWDEIGRYDLPAMIDFILNKTHHSQLIYVGHSQGTTSFFVMASERPENNEKVSLMVAMAPAGAVPHLRSPYLLFFKYASLMHPDVIIEIIRTVGLNEISSENGVLQAFTRAVCGYGELILAICSNVLFQAAGFNYSQMNITILPVVLSHSSSGASTKQIEHYAQSVTSRKFQRFDYGAAKNKMLYGSSTPPEYNLGAITTPIALFYSTNDWLAAEPDVHHLRSKLKHVIDYYKVPDEKFNHVDFMFAKDIRKLIFSRLIKLVQRYM